VANGKLNFTQSENKPSQAADEKDKPAAAAAPAAWEICNKIMLKENLRHRTGKFREERARTFSRENLVVSPHVRAVKMKIESNKKSPRHTQHGVYVMSGKKLSISAFQPAIRGS